MSDTTEETTPCLCGKWRPIDKVCRNPGCIRYNKLSRGMVDRGITPEAAGVSCGCDLARAGAPPCQDPNCRRGLGTQHGMILCLCEKWRLPNRVCRTPGCAWYNKMSASMIDRGITPAAAGVVPAVLAVQGALVLESAHGPDTIILTLAAPPTMPGVSAEVTAKVVAAAGHGAAWVRGALGLDPEVVKKG